MEREETETFERPAFDEYQDIPADYNTYAERDAPTDTWSMPEYVPSTRIDRLTRGIGSLFRKIKRVPQGILGAVATASTPVVSLFKGLVNRVTSPSNVVRIDEPSRGILSRAMEGIKSFSPSLPSANTVGKIAKYGLPVALAALLAGAVGYAVYANVNLKKDKKKQRVMRSKALDEFMLTVARSAPTVLRDRPDLVDRVEAVASDVIKNAKSEPEATEALTGLLGQILTVERRLVPSIHTPGYYPRPVGGRIRSPLLA